MNPFFATQLMKRLSKIDKPASTSTASSTPRWAVVLTWVLVLAAVALLSWLLFELSRISAH